MLICAEDTRPVATNFAANEFYSHCPDAPPCHEVDDRLIEAAQFMRQYFNHLVEVNSTYRTKLCNSLAGGVSTSTHMEGTGMDLDFGDGPDEDYYLSMAADDILNKGPFYRGLRKIGINAIGLYDTHLHLDTRTRELKDDDPEFGPWRNWDHRIRLKSSEVSYLEAIGLMLTDPEEGFLRVYWPQLVGGLVGLAVIIVVLVMVFKKR